jgi:hypothetical protein
MFRSQYFIEESDLRRFLESDAFREHVRKVSIIKQTIDSMSKADQEFCLRLANEYLKKGEISDESVEAGILDEVELAREEFEELKEVISWMMRLFPFLEGYSQREREKFGLAFMEYHHRLRFLS